MKNIACYIMSGILAAAFLPFMMMNVSAEEGDEESYYSEESINNEASDGENESSYEEESNDDESSYEEEESSNDESNYEEESSNDESSYEEESSNDESSYEEESSGDESSYEEESSNDESSYEEESSGDESSYEEEESSNDESSREEERSRPDTEHEDDEPSVPEEVVKMTYIPKNDPLSWLTTIETVIPSEKRSEPVSVIVTEESVFDEVVTEHDTEAEVSSVSVKTVRQTVTSENTGNDSKSVFLVGLIIFSLVGMIATFSVIAFLRSRGMFTPTFLKFESKKKHDDNS